MMDYEILYSSRKTMSLEITKNGDILVRAPYLYRKKKIDEFVSKNSDWILKKIEYQKTRLEKSEIIDERKDELMTLAKSVIPQRVAYYSELMKLYPTSVKITSAKTRFGSCSGKNGICFSWHLMAYPMEAVDYVVVHELAHIKHHNHGKHFYALIEKILPDYKKRIALLKA